MADSETLLLEAARYIAEAQACMDRLRVLIAQNDLDARAECVAEMRLALYKLRHSRERLVAFGMRFSRLGGSR